MTSRSWERGSKRSMGISANDIHRRAIIVDGHCDSPYRMLRHNVHLDEHDTEAQLDLKTLRASGITASFFAGRGAANFAHRLITLIHEEAQRHPEDLTFCADSAGIRAAKRDGRHALM